MSRCCAVLFGALGISLAAGIPAAYFKLASATDGVPVAMLQVSATMLTISFAVIALAYNMANSRVRYWLGRTQDAESDELRTGQRLLRELRISLWALAVAAFLLLVAFVLASVAAGIENDISEPRKYLVSSSLGFTLLAAEALLLFMWLAVPFSEIRVAIDFLAQRISRAPAPITQQPAPTAQPKENSSEDNPSA